MENPEAQKYREERVKQLIEVREFITERYDAFYEVAEMLSKKDRSGTRIETPFGDFIIYPIEK